jgi:hypothetical protein
VIEPAAARLDRFLRATVELMRVLARACGHRHLRDLSADDLTTFKPEVAALTGVRFGGVSP